MAWQFLETLRPNGMQWPAFQSGGVAAHAMAWPGSKWLRNAVWPVAEVTALFAEKISQMLLFRENGGSKRNACRND